METLLRQKVCKSKHNFLITKQLHRKKLLLVGCFSVANGSGIFRIHFPAIRTARRFAPIGARRDSHRILGYKKTWQVYTYQVLFL